MVIDNGKKQVVVLYVATFVGVILNFVASKINTDNLSPSDYGDVRYVLNAIQMISWLVLFGWFMSGSRLLALSNDGKYSARIRGAMVTYLGIAMLLLALVTCVAGIVHIGKPAIMTLFFCAIPVCIYPLLTNYMNTTAQGDNHIGRLALARALPVLCYIPCALLIYRHYGADSKTVLWLHWGICSVVLLIIIASTKPRFHELKPIFESVRKENQSYGKQLYWGSLAMVATTYLAGVTLGWFNEDNTNVGFFTLALSFAQPLSYLPGIVGTAYFKRFVNESRIPRNVLYATILLSVITCVGFVVLVKPVFSLYNESYGIVAKYAAILAVGFSIHGIGDMINRYLGSHGLGKSIRNSSFACGAVKVLGSFLFVWLWNVNGAILTCIVSSTVYTLLLWFYYKRAVKSGQLIER